MKKYLSLIKFSHTIFALPFALLGFTLGTISNGGDLDLMLLVYVLLCMVFARSAAMAFNRYIDRDIDAANPRTAVREIPAGAISARSALFFVLVNCFAFIVVCAFINPLCLYLSPVALAVILGYSYTKRFTALCHLILGLGLGLAPLGAYLAVTASFSLEPIMIGLAVLFWVAGFDVIYALQDADFDQGEGLFSIPSYFGPEKALSISRLLHFLCALSLGLGLYLIIEQYDIYTLLVYIAWGFFALMLIYQHRLVRPNDLSKVNLAFFTTNGVASIVFCSLLMLALYIA